MGNRGNGLIEVSERVDEEATQFGAGMNGQADLFGHHHGGSGLVDPVQQLHDPDRGDGIEVSARLIGKEQWWVVDKRAGH